MVPIRVAVPKCSCKKDEILGVQRGSDVMKDCVICLEANVLCRIGLHPLSTGAHHVTLPSQEIMLDVMERVVGARLDAKLDAKLDTYNTNNVNARMVAAAEVLAESVDSSSEEHDSSVVSDTEYNHHFTAALIHASEYLDIYRNHPKFQEVRALLAVHTEAVNHLLLGSNDAFNDEAEEETSTSSFRSINDLQQQQQQQQCLSAKLLVDLVTALTPPSNPPPLTTTAATTTTTAAADRLLPLVDVIWRKNATKILRLNYELELVLLNKNKIRIWHGKKTCGEQNPGNFVTLICLSRSAHTRRWLYCRTAR